MAISFLQILVLVFVLIFVLNFKPFRFWIKSYHKSGSQKKAIRFLIFGPRKSKINTKDYDELCLEMYTDDCIFEKAKAKLGISDSDLVIHPHVEIDSKFLVVRNYLGNVKNKRKDLFCQIGKDDFRSAQMLAIMVLFGKEKLYFYKLYYRTDKTKEKESSYEYEFDKINSFIVNGGNYKELVNVSFEINWTDENDKAQRMLFPSMQIDKDAYNRWLLVSCHLDTPALRKEYAAKSDSEKKAFRYFRAHNNLPPVISDEEYEDMICHALPAEQLKLVGMDNMDIRDSDIQFAAPISFRSFVYGDNLEVEGKDHSWRSNTPQHTWLFFGKRQIYVYSTSIRMDTSMRQDSTQEIFYNDIASVKTEQFTKEKEQDGIHYIMTYYQFIILFAGDRLTLTLPILSNQNDQKIRAMRNLLRETKHQQQPTIIDGKAGGDEIV